MALTPKKRKSQNKEKVPNKVGRPTVMKEDVLEKLRVAFQMGFNDREACIYANIDPQTLYNYQEKNPEFIEQKEQYKKAPILKAKKTIFDNLDNPKIACWYAERKCKEEFSSQQVITGNLDIQKVFITEKEHKEAEKHIQDVINEQ